MALQIVFDETQLLDGLGSMDEGRKEAMRATRSDFRTRSHTAVERGIKKHYNIDSGRVRKDKKAWRNVGEYGGEQDYTSSPIGIQHFGMTPKKQPGRRGATRKYVSGLDKQVRMPAPYTINFMVKKAPANLGPEGGYFVAKGMAWKRTSNNPKPIERITTLSVAAMMVNDAKEDIEKELDEFLEERFAHNLERFCG